VRSQVWGSRKKAGARFSCRAVVGAPASAVGQSTTAQRLRISWTFDPATLAAARFNEPDRSGGDIVARCSSCLITALAIHGG